MSILVIFWTFLVFLSIAWYAILLFYIGIRGGKEILEMTRTLKRNNPTKSNESDGTK